MGSMTGVTGKAADETASGMSNNMLEIASIAICVLVPAVYFNVTQKNTKESKVPSADDASARLRAKANKPSNDTEAVDAETRPLSEILRAEDPSPKQPQSKQAMNLARWNQAINNAAKAGEPSKAVQLLSEIEKAGLQPDTISYNSVIHAHAKQGDIRAAEKWLLKMHEKGVKPNTISYNILMDTCVKANDAAGAEAWLERMRKDGVDANEVSYATVIHARAKKGDSAGAERWLRKMIAEGVEPNVVSYNSLIYACGKRGE